MSVEFGAVEFVKCGLTAPARYELAVMSETDMSETRSIEQSIQLAAHPDSVFEALITPTAICQWWKANRAIVYAADDGFWTAAWGDDVDRPEYTCSYPIVQCDGPSRLVLGNPIYHSPVGGLPFDADFRVEFEIVASDHGSTLTVRQTGFPVSTDVDEFYAGCVNGWQETLGNLARYLSQ